jgi:ankyrin repeat protein
LVGSPYLCFNFLIFQFGMTALHIACYSGCSEAVDFLLSTRRIDVNLEDKVNRFLQCNQLMSLFFFVLFQNGSTALHYACRWEHDKCVSLLLSAHERNPERNVEINHYNNVRSRPSLLCNDCNSLLLVGWCSCRNSWITRNQCEQTRPGRFSS